MEYWTYYLYRQKKKQKKREKEKKNRKEWQLKNGQVAVIKKIKYARFNYNHLITYNREIETKENYECIKDVLFKIPYIPWSESRKGTLINRKHFYKDTEFRTLFYYGSKVSWQSEFTHIFEYLKNEGGCNKLLDSFGGSGILSVLGSRCGYDVYLNDMSDLIANYHKCIKNYESFYQFMVLVESYGSNFKYLTKNEVVRKLLELDGEDISSDIGVKYIDGRPVFSANLTRQVSDWEIDKLYQRHQKTIDKFISEKNTEYIEQRRKVYKEIATSIDGHINEWYDDEKLKKYYDIIDAKREAKATSEGKEAKKVKRRTFTDTEKENMKYFYEYDSRPNIKWAVLYYIYRYYTFYGATSFAKGRPSVVYNLLDLVNTQQYYDKISVSRMHYNKFIKNDLFNENAVITLDVPYLDYVRAQKEVYAEEFSLRNHRSFLERITQAGIKAKLIVCGYSSSFYDRRLHKCNVEKQGGWRKVSILKAGLKKRSNREVLWVNFDFSPIAERYDKEFKVIPEDEWDYSYLTEKRLQELKEMYEIYDDANTDDDE